jgi:hypothetical protein
MQANRSFWKAVHSLSHPISVLAILLLLFNDHYLRWHYPSWLTGKLGDFSWLVFAPFIAAMLFSWLSPQRSRLIGLLLIAFIGIWFASFKTIPFVMDLTKTVLEALVDWRGSLGMDATDLLTLPALGISWYIWKNAREDRQYLRPVIYVAFGLGIMGTLATSYLPPPPPYVSIVCEMADGSLQADTWESRDGGLNWVDISEWSSIAVRCSDEDRLSTRNFDNGYMYRWIRGERVEYSIDEGVSWSLLRDLHELKQEARVLLNHDTGGGDFGIPRPYLPSPVSGIVHSQTGNLVLVMSADGVLVITENGESYWATVGDYQLVDLNDWTNIRTVLNFYFFLIPTLAFLILVTTIVFIHRSMSSWVTFGWLAWFLLLFTSNLPGQSTNGLLSWGLIALLSLFLIAVPMSLWALYHLLWHYRSAILPILISGTISCLGNFFPIFLWSQGTIPRYDVAVLFSISLTAAVLATCYAYFRPKLPNRFVAEKSKRKNDAA